jgi:NhaA family Na+:H+ antiporter
MPVRAPDPITSGAAQRPIARLTQPIQRFLALEASSSLLLLAATVLALVWANSPWGHVYEAWLHLPLSLRIGGFELSLSLGHFVNDALMSLFFFVVGMEIKRELVIGELASVSRALLPVVAALGGMVVPAAIYACFHWGLPTIRGWGVPMATDIAFAVAALSIFGPRVPPGLKVFLLALAIADDIGAVAVIAVFYTADVSPAWLAAALAGLAGAFGLNLAGVRAYSVYVAVGALVWLAMHESGVHATIAGVALGLLTPARPLDAVPPREAFVERGVRRLERLGELIGGGGDHSGHERHRLAQRVRDIARSTLSPADELSNQLHPWVAFAIMPVFALANAGVRLDPETLADPVAIRVGLGVALGLVLGKPLGIVLFTWLAVRTGIAEAPRVVTFGQIAGTGFLAGIGFTVALFVSALAFDGAAETAGSKLGILAGSLVATLIGVALLARTLPRASANDAGGGSAAR